MITPTRTLHILLVLFVFLLFYLSGHFSSSKPAPKRTSNADARLARWLETVSPPDQSLMLPPEHAAAHHAAYNPVRAKSRPLVPLDPYPLGRPTNTYESLPQATFHGQEFANAKFSFQDDLQLPEPKADLKKYKDHTPRNYFPGYKQETFATFLCTPNASIHDPYFSATLNLVYRNLWSPETASKSRPFTVFVAPFITQEQRDILAGAGAVIVELPLLPWEPNVSGVWGRWRDQFSKLHMWAQMQYTAIAFMDSDAFPIKNVDSVFDEVVPQTCADSKLSTEDEKMKDDICQYTFAGVENIGGDGSVNGGFLFIVPNRAMHHRLLRNYVKVDEYDNRVAEQSFFQWQFSQDGPFPVQLLPRKYNAFFPQDGDEGRVSIVHEKLWAWGDDISPWLRGNWERSWQEMIDFYDSPEFVQARKGDNEVKMVPRDQGSKWSGGTPAAKLTSAPVSSSKVTPKAERRKYDASVGVAQGNQPPPLTEKQRKMLERRRNMKTPWS